ncbi:MFS transporter [Micromonospora sp. WMMD980]|uniref:MFS transporter n=1 Tax=Micromonospora sp. WMMD980 TaxID=3016088 RepID=UPI002415D4D2|nr:MFS transporter [Micromonospora sp. WMMD980]MDG4800246.1 MFS transporter [Micromonospora sp. WMMD980]
MSAATGPTLTASDEEQMSTVTDPPRAGSERRASLWRNRDFNLLWISQCFSDLGAAMSNLAMPLLVLFLTGSAAQAGLVGSAGLVTTLACRLPAGVVADRFSRRTLLVACDVVRLVAYLGLSAAVFAGAANLPMVLAVTVVGAAANAVFGTAEHAAVRNLVPPGQLATAVARNEARSYGTQLAGPPLGGLLYGLGRSLPFVGNAVSYLLSLLAVLLIRRPMEESRAERTRQSGGAAAAEGVRFVLANPFLRALLVIAAPLNMAFTGMIFAIIVSLQRTGTPSVLVGLASTIFGLGGFLGALAAPAVQRWLRLPTLVVVLCWATTGLMATSALVSSSLLAAVPLAAAVFLAPTANAVLFGYQAAVTPDRLQGRVVSVIYLAATSAAALAPGLAGLLLARFPAAVTMLVFAGLVAVSAVTATLSNGIRSMNTDGGSADSV